MQKIIDNIRDYLGTDLFKGRFQGVIAGGVAIVVIGFGWGGWTLSSTAENAAAERAQAATVAALAPICAAAFQREPSQERWSAFEKARYYEREELIKKLNLTQDSNVASACATKLTEILDARKAKK